MLNTDKTLLAKLKNKQVLALLAVFASGLILPLSKAVADAHPFEYSGYLHLVGGFHDDGQYSYFGYDEDWTQNVNSAIGLQGIWNMNRRWSLTGQLLGHSSKRIDSGVEWLYLTFKPNDSWSFKAGKMQAPFYSLSDVLDVGYAYPWVIAPKEVYNDFIFRNFNGFDARYSLALQESTINIEAYIGQYDDSLLVDGIELDIDVDRFYGLIGEWIVNQWQLRASYHRGNFDLDVPPLEQLGRQLNEAGFSRSATDLSTISSADFYQLGIQYDSIDHFVKGEAAYIDPGAAVFPEISSAYISYGYVIDRWTAILTYGKRNDSVSTPTQEIPIGDNPQWDILAAGYNTVLELRRVNDSESWTLGLRWDFNDNMALKTEVKRVLLGDNNSAGLNLNADGTISEADSLNLLLIGFDWIF